MESCPACLARLPSRVYGKPNIRRCDEPNMFQILAWGEKESNPRYASISQVHPCASDCIYKPVEGLEEDIKIRDIGFSGHKNCQCKHQRGYLGPNRQALRWIEDKKIQEKGFNNLEKAERHQKSQVKINLKRAQEVKINTNKGIPKDNLKKISTVKYAQRLKRQLINAKQKKKDNGQENSLAKMKSQSKIRFKKDDLRYGKRQPKSPKYQNKSHEKLTDLQTTQLIRKFKQQTRWIPNSSFATYFGRPPFENYGNKNTHTQTGGILYGTYLYSHNVYPHRGGNSPKYAQCYSTSLQKAKSMGSLHVVAPRTLCSQEFSSKINKKGLSIYPQKSKDHLEMEGSKLDQIPKFRLKKYGKGQLQNEQPYYSEVLATNSQNEPEKDFGSMLGRQVGRRVNNL